MEITNLIGAKTREEPRQWLEENAKTADCCWVIVSMKEQEGLSNTLMQWRKPSVLVGSIALKRKLLITSLLKGCRLERRRVTGQN